MSEKFWSGGLKDDPKERDTADVFVDGSRIRIGVSERDENRNAMIDLSFEQAEKLIGMLTEALLVARMHQD
jgi:hypothetical protein